MLKPAVVLIVLAITLVGVAVGVGVAWLLRRRSTLSVRNLYPPAVLAVLLLAAAVALRWWVGVLIVLPIGAPWIAGAASGRRWRLADLGAGEELRNHELARRWGWQPAPRRAPGERQYLRSQGELVRERPWPRGVAYVPMTALGEAGPRLPLGAGQHVVLFGATGAGKTTTARRLVAGRTLAQHAALFILDQKGDEEDVHEMRRLAHAAGVPFILFDSQDPGTDRWQPLWGTPDGVAARCVEPIKQSEPYYYDVLRRHLDIVCKVLHAADRWPPSIPFLVDACLPVHYSQVLAIAERLDDDHNRLARRAKDHARYVSSPKGTDDLSGGAFRLEVALALASRQLVTPRITSDGEAVAVRLVEALRQRAVVMWRTHADTMPDEAAALSVLALADLHDAAEQAGAPWTLLLDEFGAVIKMAAARGVAILQRGRSHGGQVIVITQSAADVEALTGQPGLLASLTDNFTGVVAHRQTSPESRDWLAKLMGTRALWQHTNQTAGHGSQHSGRGSARRVREFRIGSDVFSELSRGEAVIYTSLAGDPARAEILPVHFADGNPERIEQTGARHPCEVPVHPEESLPELAPTSSTGTSSAPADEIDPDTI
ncbi:MAG: type IV secretion system DNA-binding domain-containing protein [Actinomycetota bacterium]|nr:type IV secretion system DNA-binding domain-containing protein [Actinomycetota bacterium]